MAKRAKKIQKPKPLSTTGKWFDTAGIAPTAAAKRKTVSRANAEPVDFNQELVVWSVRLMDHRVSGDWDWDLSAEELRHLLMFGEETQKKTWGEVLSETVGSSRSRHRKHHDHEVQSLPKESREKLALALEGEILPENLFRFRLQGKIRLWGQRDGKVFQVIWYDRAHRVYPIERN